MGNDLSGFLGLDKSKARRALFALFFTNPDQEYFPRQLERLTGVLVGNLQRELVRMEGAQLLSSRRLGKLKLYKLNIRHPLYPELKGLVGKTVGLEDAIRGRLGDIDGIEAACIYGSFARDQQRAESDIDLLVIGDADEKALIRTLRDLEKRLQREINYSLYTGKEWKKRKAVGDPFILEVLRRPRLPLVGDVHALR
ncbi:MAG: nucleotidyltransferase domain-containing protein [Elusimicrobiota bacterium]